MGVLHSHWSVCGCHEVTLGERVGVMKCASGQIGGVLVLCWEGLWLSSSGLLAVCVVEWVFSLVRLQRRCTAGCPAPSRL